MNIVLSVHHGEPGYKTELQALTHAHEQSKPVALAVGKQSFNFAIREKRSFEGKTGGFVEFILDQVEDKK